ncbi:MAG: HAD family hydrolase [Pseudomonadota bacterium]
MASNRVPLAIVYDFDGTLAPGNMQERDFIPALKMKSRDFWRRVKAEAEKHDADEILSYMHLMLDRAQAHQVTVRKQDFQNYGKNLPLFNGLVDYVEQDENKDGWFDRIKKYATLSGIKAEHYIVSSGMREMVEGSAIAKHFRMIYASGFMYDHHGVANWPALALNYTTKTQYIFRINKGSLRVYDHSKINRHIPKKEREVPFENMIFIGDGETDIPCFRLVTEQGGNAIAVYKPNTRGARSRCEEYVKQGRVKFIAPADYRDGRPVDRIVKSIIDKLASDHHLDSLRP